LGDISNKKGGDHSNARGGGGGKAKIGDTNTSTTRKPAAKIWNDSVTPRRLPLQPSSIKQKQQQQLNKPKEVSSLKPSRTVAFQLPQRHSQSLVLPHAKTVLQEPLTAQPELEPVDDVEFSAGRLFCDQVENDDDDDLSVLSIEAPLSMWDDWKFALKLQVQEQQQMTIAQDAKLQAKINQVMAQDGKSWLLYYIRNERNNSLLWPATFVPTRTHARLFCFLALPCLAFYHSKRIGLSFRLGG
jgi:hypothetical protein